MEKAFSRGNRKTGRSRRLAETPEKEEVMMMLIGFLLWTLIKNTLLYVIEVIDSGKEGNK